MTTESMETMRTLLRLLLLFFAGLCVLGWIAERRRALLTSVAA